MAKQPPKTRPSDQDYFANEIDFFELLHFIVKGLRYWLSGGFIFGSMAIIYAFTLYPQTYQQLSINDIGLNQEKLSLIRQIMPAMMVPLEDKMQAQGLGNLYNRITQGGEAYLDKTIFGVSGLDLKDTSLDNLSKVKVDTVVIRTKGNDEGLAKDEIDFIRNNIRGVSQYLEVKKYIDNEIINARIDLFNTEAEVNKQELNYERTSRQLLSYRALQKKSNNVKDVQIVLNLSNDEMTARDKQILNNISEFSGAKYLPLSNRIIALQSEMADHQEAVRISHFQIDALKLSQKVLNDLASTFNATPYQGDVINLSPMMQLIQDYRQQKTNYTREDISALDKLEVKLIDFDRGGYRFSNNLPMEIKQQGRVYFIIIGGSIGAILGFLFYTIISLFNAYSRRYKN